MELTTVLTKQEMRDLLAQAERFKIDSHSVRPRIFTGHPVAHANPESSRVKNFSTITRVTTLVSGRRVFLVCRYPSSWIHSLSDNLQRWGTGRPSRKPYRELAWQQRFEYKSRIPLYRLGLPGIVAMPYIDNYNLHDVLYHNAGNLGSSRICAALLDVCRQLNDLHARGLTWGEMIVNNIILERTTLEPIICDTEVEYVTGTPQLVRQIHDWRDFIFSVAGACRLPNSDPLGVSQSLFFQIKGSRVREALADYCRRRRSLGQILFWQGMSGALSCSWQRYDEIRRYLCEMTEDLAPQPEPAGNKT